MPRFAPCAVHNIQHAIFHPLHTIHCARARFYNPKLYKPPAKKDRREREREREGCGGGGHPLSLSGFYFYLCRGILLHISHIKNQFPTISAPISVHFCTDIGAKMLKKC